LTRDLRRYARQTNARLFIGFVLILFLIGDGLIYLIYGPRAALMGLLCLGMGLAPLLIIVLFLSLLDWLVQRENKQ
jgi:hypothetical protein